MKRKGYFHLLLFNNKNVSSYSEQAYPLKLCLEVHAASKYICDSTWEKGSSRAFFQNQIIATVAKSRL